MLYFLPTPIGNLEDITLRTLNLFKILNIFFAEDTRTFKSLLHAYQIPLADKKIYSYHSFSSPSSAQRVVELAKTQDIGIVSEAGTPWLSDPGKQLIKYAHQKQVKFSVLPGANALIPAVVGACFDTHQFIFGGFFPAKKWVKKQIKQVLNSVLPVFFYESVHRIAKHLEMFLKEGFDRKVLIAREISKKYEQIECQTLDQIVAKIQNQLIPLKWEFVVWFEGKT